MAIKFILAFTIVIVSIRLTEKKTDQKGVSNIESQTSGKEFFLLNCANCHHATRDVTGPSIYGVRNRWKNKTLLYQYVRNSQEVIKKDPYAKALFKKWNNTIMTPFPKLSNKDIDAIFDYVDGEAQKKGLL